jgi:peptide/nickel transport system substrate-binding protein
MRRFLLAAVISVAAAVSSAASAQTLRVVMHSDVKALDPIWSGAYITRNHGYMLYDTLFAMDEKFQVRPQMVESWSTSDDGLTWTFRLRDGLEWHDGTPVTSEDCVASLKRWSARDSMGQKLAQSLQEYRIVDPRTFQIVLQRKFGPLLEAIGKPSVVVPFMMPKKTAETDAFKPIDDYIGSGPFVFKRDEWKPGEKLVYLRNPKYKPRPEPMSGLAGGKVVSLDRIEWIWIPDPETQLNALLSGEIDMIENVSHDHLPVLEKDRNVRVIPNRTPGQYVFRMNWLQAPFDNVKIRQAAAYALNQEEFLQAGIGDKRFYRLCKAMFTCDTPFATTAGMEGLIEGNAAQQVRQAQRKAGHA